jgi:very-short-patch-repair endonuclease
MPNDRARDARRHPTTAEAALWQLLRNRRFAGYKFRRQHPVGPFIADFACLALRLVVELDGSQHVERVADVGRTEWLESEGWHVVRFWNNDVLNDAARVLDALFQSMALCREQHPHPPRYAR